MKLSRQLLRIVFFVTRIDIVTHEHHYFNFSTKTRSAAGGIAPPGCAGSLQRSPGLLVPSRDGVGVSGSPGKEMRLKSKAGWKRREEKEGIRKRRW